MTSQKELLDDLFVKWEKAMPEYKGKFVKDGINDCDRFSKARLKILFIAKEPNKPSQEPGDYSEWWEKELAYTFSYRIAQWSYGLLNGFPPFDKVNNSYDLAHEAIQQIAFMNIKKSGGGGNANHDALKEHLKKNLDFLHQQIDIISPDIIITGLSVKMLRNELFPNVEWVKSGYDIDIGRYKDARVIDYYHPSARMSGAASYSLLQNITNSNPFRKL